MLDFEIFLLSLIPFIVALFALYRLLIQKYELINNQNNQYIQSLISNYSEHISMLKDEIAFKHNNKSRLEEIELFYNKEKEILTKKINEFHTENEIYTKTIDQLNINLSEVKSEINDKQFQVNKLEKIRKNQTKYLEDQLKLHRIQITELIAKDKDNNRRYCSLVKFIKEKYGITALLDFHYGDDPYEYIKHRRKYNIMQRYSKLKIKSSA